MHNSKVCFKCEILKPLLEFYKHKKMGDGFLNKCKDCTKLDTKLNTEKNRDYYLEYDRQRANLPKRVEARKAYAQTLEGKLVVRKAKDKWSVDNVIKRSASLLVVRAVKNKKLIKEYKCQVCAIENVIIHGHHDDYNYPLSVRWLCSQCHTNWHKINGSGING